MKTGLAGPHYAASSGRLETIRMLLKKGIPLEVKNMYGGTVFGQAIWSAVNEHTPDHAAIVEHLVEAGAVVDDGYLEWWEKQDVPDATTKKRIAEILERQAEFDKRVSQAEQQVAEAESGSKHSLADALKHLGSILRQPAFTRGAANEAYERAAALYAEVGLPLEEAWVKRHIGINHEYAGRLEDAEALYDEALALYREHATEDDLDYANTVRYPAVIKARLGKRDEAAQLWEEACRRYEAVGIIEGVVEANARMAELAIEEGDVARARDSFDRAAAAAGHSANPDTRKLVDEVRAKMERAENAY
jgi:tetratricopeptide (TPR) repeat protein